MPETDCLIALAVLICGVSLICSLEALNLLLATVSLGLVLPLMRLRESLTFLLADAAADVLANEQRFLEDDMSHNSRNNAHTSDTAADMWLEQRQTGA